MQAFAIAFLSAVLALVGTGFSRWWQYGRDAWNARVDRACQLIESCVEDSTSYWLDEVPGALSSSEEGEVPTRPIERVKAEAKIIGSGVQIEGMISTLCSRFSEKNTTNIWSRYSELLEATQGGSFQSTEVRFDADRPRQVHQAGAYLIVAIRAAVDDAFTIDEASRRHWRWCQTSVWPRVKHFMWKYFGT